MANSIYTDLLGCKFTPHGRSKEEGFDCYGLVIEVMRRNGITLYDAFYKDLQNKEETYFNYHCKNSLVKIEKVQNNCIIEISVNGKPAHIAVYIGNGLMIHAVVKLGVVIEPIARYKKRIMGYYKVSNN